MRIFQVDAFTREPFTGNPAVVVLDDEGRNDAVLMTIAREFAHAEVAFISAATAPDHDIRLKFFNSRKEAPFVGHATLAAHAVLLATGRRQLGVCRQFSGTGIIEVRATASLDPAAVMIEFRQTAADLGAPLPPQTTHRVAEALRMASTRLHRSLPARIARKGSTRLLMPVADTSALDTLRPDFDALVRLGDELEVEGFFVFSLDSGGHPSSNAHRLATESRMFCPVLGIPEDPVSGNAHAMLASYLWKQGLFAKNSTTFIGRQGRQMKRPGEVSVKLEIDRDSLIAAYIGGGAVIVSEGTLSI